MDLEHRYGAAVGDVIISVRSARSTMPTSTPPETPADARRHRRGAGRARPRQGFRGVRAAAGSIRRQDLPPGVPIRPQRDRGQGGPAGHLPVDLAQAGHVQGRRSVRELALPRRGQHGTDAACAPSGATRRSRRKSCRSATWTTTASCRRRGRTGRSGRTTSCSRTSCAATSSRRSTRSRRSTGRCSCSATSRGCRPKRRARSSASRCRP